MADAADPISSAEANAGILAGLDAFVKSGGLSRAEKAEAARTAGDDVEDVEGDGNEPESGEPEVQAQGEAESESDDEQEDAVEGEDVEKPQTYTVKVDGQDVTVTLDELTAGYSREADYRRKTATHAETVRKWEADKETLLKADREALSSEREQYKAVLGVWKQQLESLTSNNTPEWEALRRDNPAEWSAKMLERRAQLDQLGAVVAEQQRLANEDRTKQETALKQKFEREAQKMLEAIPEWKDQKAYLADSGQILDYTTGLGYGADEVKLAVANDHRLARVLKDAAAYRALQAKKPEAQKKVAGAKPLPPGPAAPKVSSASNLKRLMETQAKRGDREATAALFDAIGLSR